MKIDAGKLTKELEKDLLHFLEIVPKTLAKVRDGYAVLGFDNWSFYDCILAPTGIYITDLESCEFHKVNTLSFERERISSIYYIDDFFNCISAVYRHVLPEKNGDMIVENMIDTLNSSKYIEAELKEIKRYSPLNCYTLNLMMGCKSGIDFNFEKILFLT